MEIDSSVLFIEINNSEYNFAVCEKDKKNNFNVIFKNSIPLQGIKNYKITDLEIAIVAIKKNIYLIEQKLNTIFKETVLILDNLNRSFISLTGYKKLNGSQILKENITYILNSLKSNIDECETQKTITHIFNTKYYLDKKKIENLPIGLFGDFYSHELSFSLIKKNDYKNLNYIFNKCNLNIKKILFKSFIEGTLLSDENSNLDTFLKVKINKKDSQVFYFENDALKFEQNFNFGSDLVLNDISKITSLNYDNIRNILIKTKLEKNERGDYIDQYVEKELFENLSYRKIKKKLIFDVAESRIQELSELFVTKNINLNSYLKNDTMIFLSINDVLNLECFNSSYRNFFSNNDYFNFKFINNIETSELINKANEIVNFGWKKEAIPVIQSQKSLIARFFDILFS
jgi:cell division protein FtsA